MDINEALLSPQVLCSEHARHRAVGIHSLTHYHHTQTVFSITVFAVCSAVTFACVICTNNKESSDRGMTNSQFSRTYAYV